MHINTHYTHTHTDAHAYTQSLVQPHKRDRHMHQPKGITATPEEEETDPRVKWPP